MQVKLQNAKLHKHFALTTHYSLVLQAKLLFPFPSATASGARTPALERKQFLQ